MGELVFIGLGLFDCLDISLRGLEEVKSSDYVFAEFYTSLMPGFKIDDFRRISGKSLTVLLRKDIEDDGGRIILEKAEDGKVALLVPGDPLIATTHISLRIKAEKMGIKTRVIHGASILSAAIGLSGLQNYRFGKSVTIPFPENGVSRTPYTVIYGNKMMNLHTFCFLDIRSEEAKYMSIREALKILLKLEEINGQNIVREETLAVGVARAGSNNPTVKAGAIKDLIGFDFGGPPHSLIIPSERLHFMEAEALIMFAGAPDWVRGMIG
ncbi:MAG: diphthine synthase [Candidatus Bathyarchaeota archaeon]|nr:diphthine synthase [Candidatus Bathyarchaeota archaeon]